MSFDPSPKIVSRQIQPHPRLQEVVYRHRDTEYQENIPEYAQQSFECVQQWVQQQAKPIILDSGCGTGESSLYLARKYPQCCVLGDDKSAWVLHSHYLLYPNPWPKSGHVQRRWHAHPVFPNLCQLGGEIILRTNWHIYAQEFAQAICFLTDQEWSVDRVHVEQPITPHERKYLHSGHELYQVRGRLHSVYCLSL